MKVSQLRKLIKESIQDNLQTAKNTSVEGKIKQCDALIKIYSDQCKMYTKLADEADKLVAKDSFPELAKEAKSLREKAEQKSTKLTTVEAHKETLEASIGKETKEKKKDKPSK